MKTRRITYYDPLYDFVTFEEAAVSEHPRSFFDVAFTPGDSRTHGESISPYKEAKELLPFLSTIEFARQGFLRQSNLAFLVFPSATHTRLAHAIGSCYLGFLAAQRIVVGTRPNEKTGESTQPEYLSHFLQKCGLLEEFYLALLLHDVGHFPFSHALESNKDFWEAFGREIHHEQVACELIQGRGPMYDASIRRARTQGSKNNYPHLAQCFSGKSKIDKDAICFLISADRDYLSKKTLRKQVKLLVLHELVSGLLDLDRVDHYRRDNYFSGLRSGTSPNFPSLLSGIAIYYDPSAPNHDPRFINSDPKRYKRDLELRLSSSAIGPAISLLQTKERLTEDCFEHPDCIAYEVMLHHALNLHLFGDDFYEADSISIRPADEDYVYDLLLSTDEQLLFHLLDQGSEHVKAIIFRIINRLPYYAAGKLQFRADHNSTLSGIRSQLASEAKIEKKDVVLRPSKRFGERDPGKRSEEWLDLDRLRNDKGTPLADSKYKRQIEHFKAAQETPDFVWVFSTDEEKTKRLKATLPSVSQMMHCEEVEI
jgi:HD superfamily phosphohydrolase